MPNAAGGVQSISGGYTPLLITPSLSPSNKNVALIQADQTHLTDLIASVAQNMFIQQRNIEDSFSPQHKNNTQHESMEQIRDLKSVTGKNLK